MRFPAVGSIFAYLVLLAVYSAALLASRLGRMIPRRRRSPSGCLVVTGTFYSRNWFASHARPLAASGLDRVVFVSDMPQEAPAGVEFLCPPRWATVCLGRALAKSVWLFVAGWRYDPDIFMGFHLVPGAIGALMAARWFGRQACYQMTGGPIEIIGGGYSSENSVTRLLRKPSRRLEYLAMRVACEHDLLVVRGSSAKAFFANETRCGTVEVITGSIPAVKGRPLADRHYDMVFVGRLASMKQPEQFVEIAARVSRGFPSLRAVVVGDGPELDELKRHAARLGVDENVEFLGQCSDVMGVLCRSKVFVLTSKSEGLSIALAEAMGAGVPGVVADVGDLDDIVQSDDNGYLVPPNDLDAYVTRIEAILRNPELWTRLSVRASELAGRHYSVEAVAARWRRSFESALGRDAVRMAVDV